MTVVPSEISQSLLFIRNHKLLHHPIWRNNRMNVSLKIYRISTDDVRSSTTTAVGKQKKKKSKKITGEQYRSQLRNEYVRFFFFFFFSQFQPSSLVEDPRQSWVFVSRKTGCAVLLTWHNKCFVAGLRKFPEHQHGLGYGGNEQNIHLMVCFHLFCAFLMRRYTFSRS